MALTTEFYLAWGDASDLSAFGEGFARSDETLLGFKFEHKEGEFATLEATVKGNGIAYLSAARKRWTWFSYRLEGTLYARMFGRLTGIQTVRSDDGPVVILNFIAEPVDYAAQKKALANTLRVLPRYDIAFIDVQSRDDDDLVLEGYPVRYHIDPVTHVVTVSNELIGEDGLLEFYAADMRYSGFTIDLASVPASSVTVTAEMQWTQGGQGTVEFGSQIVGAWPNAPGDGTIKSYTFQSSNWPSVGASLGTGWTAAISSCKDLNDVSVRSTPINNTLIVDWGNWGFGGLATGASQTTTTVTGNDDALAGDAGPISLPLVQLTTQDQSTISRDNDGQISSFSRNTAWSTFALPYSVLKPDLTVGWQAQRACKEVVSFTLFADIQPVIGDPGSERALDPIALSTQNLSDALTAGGSDIPLGDVRLRSFVCTDRGQQSLQYMIARGQTALLHASRCIESSFIPFFQFMQTVTLRKNARIHRPEIPGGEMEGKIIAREESMQRNSGKLDCSITIASAPGNGGSITTAGGDPTYIDDDYIESDYQERSGIVETFDASVGYTPPLFAPNDDGLDLTAPLSSSEIIETAVVVTEPSNAALRALATYSGPTTFFGPADSNGQTQGANAVANFLTKANADLADLRTTVTFKLKSMNQAFTTDVPIEVTDLKIPTMIDLEAA